MRKRPHLLIAALLGFVFGLLVQARVNALPGRLIGVHVSTPQTYISGTGTSGADNSAETLYTVALPANSLTHLGDRVRIRCYFNSTGAVPITGTTAINGVPVGTITHTGAASLNLTESWMHYIDATHANIIEQEAGPLGNLSAANVTGFNWTASQNITFAQSQTLNEHLTLYALIVDLFPRGYEF